MGTNYYARINCCEHCDRPEKIIHIGKSSAGWTFSFHATDEIRSWLEWKEFLDKPNVRIFNECNEEISFEDFEKLVESKKSEPNNHVLYCREMRESDSYLQTQFLDEEGNSFSEGEFC